MYSSKEAYNAARRARRAADPEKARAVSRAKKVKLREQAFAAYGSECVCCGEGHRPFLTFDHINDDGAEHRRTLGTSSSTVLRWARRNGWPPVLQVLCWNCNCAKGACPASHAGRDMIKAVA